MSQRGKRDSYYIIAHKVGRNKREGGGQETPQTWEKQNYRNR